MKNNMWKKELAVVIIGLFVTMSFNLPVSGHELMDNHRPEKPYFIGFDGGYEGETSWIKFNTTDLDGDDVYYFIEWGDETNSGWFGPYKSGKRYL
jgi:hypothetical protein